MGGFVEPLKENSVRQVLNTGPHVRVLLTAVSNLYAVHKEVMNVAKTKS